MCKYCSHLKELRKSDKELYQGLIMKWKAANLRQEKLLRRCSYILSCLNPKPTALLEDIIEEITKDTV